MATLEQMDQMEDNSFNVDQQFVLDNKEIVAEFFASHRKWYNLLKKGGQKYKRTSLDSSEYVEQNVEGGLVDESVPLDATRINEGRAVDIEKFFIEYEQAKVDLLIHISN